MVTTIWLLGITVIVLLLMLLGSQISLHYAETQNEIYAIIIHKLDQQIGGYERQYRCNDDWRDDETSPPSMCGGERLGGTHDPRPAGQGTRGGAH